MRKLSVWFLFCFALFVLFFYFFELFNTAGYMEINPEPGTDSNKEYGPYTMYLTTMHGTISPQKKGEMYNKEIPAIAYSLHVNKLVYNKRFIFCFSFPVPDTHPSSYIRRITDTVSPPVWMVPPMSVWRAKKERNIYSWRPHAGLLPQKIN